MVKATEVKDAVLYESRQWLLSVSILAVSTGTRSFQFGFNPWVRIGPHLPFPFRREHVRLGYAWFSIGVRLLLVAYLPISPGALGGVSNYVFKRTAQDVLSSTRWSRLRGRLTRR